MVSAEVGELHLCDSVLRLAAELLYRCGEAGVDCQFLKAGLVVLKAAAGGDVAVSRESWLGIKVI